MATNKPYGDNARKGAVRKRSQRKTKLLGGGPNGADDPANSCRRRNRALGSTKALGANGRR